MQALPCHLKVIASRRAEQTDRIVLLTLSFLIHHQRDGFFGEQVYRTILWRYMRRLSCSTSATVVDSEWFRLL